MLIHTMDHYKMLKNCVSLYSGMEEMVWKNDLAMLLNKINKGVTRLIITIV